MFNKSTIHDEMIAETGVDPRNIYCQITGKVLGTLSESEYAELLHTIPLVADADEAIDELLTRTCMAARPSPVWNYQKLTQGAKDMMSERATREPKVTLAYYASILAAPKVQDGRAALTAGKESNISLIHARIKMCHKIVESDLPQQKLEEFLYSLVELDARFDLRKLHYVNLFENFSRDPDKLIEEIKSWADSLVRKQQEAIQRDLRKGYSGSDPYANGNKRSGKLYLQMYLRESPASQKTGPSLEKAKKVSAFMDMFDQFEQDLTDKSKGPKVYPTLAQINADPSLLAKPLPNKPAGKKLGFVFGKAVV